MGMSIAMMWGGSVTGRWLYAPGSSLLIVILFLILILVLIIIERCHPVSLVAIIARICLNPMHGGLGTTSHDK